MTEKLRTTGRGGFSQGKEKAGAEGPRSGNSITDQEVCRASYCNTLLVPLKEIVLPIWLCYFEN